MCWWPRAGLCCCSRSFYWALDQRGWGRQGISKRLVWPWLVLGTNAIAAYMISELLATALEMIQFTSGTQRVDVLHFVYFHLFMHVGDPGWRALLYSVAYTAVCFVPVWMLYRRRIFIKI